ncbi:MAG: hypothetical protein LUE29_07745 [Lachnospiraceae bacterium]|nr:hypothetical protein [Lachnospiraceae bacterium]
MSEKQPDAKEKSDCADRLKQQRHEAHKRYYAKTANIYPARPWTEEEIRLVMEHSIPDSELSKKLGRSMKSIQEKRGRTRRWKEAGEPEKKPTRTIPEMPDSFYESVRLWKEGQITGMEAAKRCGMANSTFRYRVVKKFGESFLREEKCVAEQLPTEEYIVERKTEEACVTDRKKKEAYVAERKTKEAGMAERRTEETGMAERKTEETNPMDQDT